MAQVTNDLKSQSAAAQAQAVSAAVQAAAAQASDQVDVVDSMQEGCDNNSASDLASMKNRRRGRPPKNSNMDLSYSPPEKKLRMPLTEASPASASNGNPHQQPEIGSTGKYSMSSNGVSNDPTSPTVAAAVAAVANHLNGHVVTNGGGGAGQGGKGGKGIRNRVFCGECTGCLKNDDCGKCRYVTSFFFTSFFFFALLCHDLLRFLHNLTKYKLYYGLFGIDKKNCINIVTGAFETSYKVERILKVKATRYI